MKSSVSTKLIIPPLYVSDGRCQRRAPSEIAPWELRAGALRVYYDIEVEPEPVVVILAIGVKRRGRVLIGGEEYTL